MMFDKVIDPGTLRALPAGFSVGVRLPWYRALSLSTVSVNLLACDGQAIPSESILFTLNGQRWSLAELSAQTETMWFITDTATLEADGVPLSPGSEHEIEAELEIRPPYIKGLKRVGRVTHSMRVG